MEDKIKNFRETKEKRFLEFMDKYTRLKDATITIKKSTNNYNSFFKSMIELNNSRIINVVDNDFNFLYYIKNSKEIYFWLLSLYTVSRVLINVTEPVKRAVYVLSNFGDPELKYGKNLKQLIDSYNVKVDYMESARLENLGIRVQNYLHTNNPDELNIKNMRLIHNKFISPIYKILVAKNENEINAAFKEAESIENGIYSDA